MDPQTKAKIKFVLHHNDDKKEEESTSEAQQGQEDDAVINTHQWVRLKDYVSLDMLEAGFDGNYNFTFDIERYWSSLLRRTGTPYRTIDYL